MRTYGQYCPVARASEVLAERWTPIILRDMLDGATTYTEIAAGSPGISRTLLTMRLRELQRVGVVHATPHPSGRGFLYHLTEAGKDLGAVMAALGTWGERWIELAPDHLDPGLVLHSWAGRFLACERLPKRRVVVQFDFWGLPKKKARSWIIFHGERSEVCATSPGFEVDLFVEAEAKALIEWHLGRIRWVDALRADRIRVHGPSKLARALPTWNRLSPAAHMKDARPREAPGPVTSTRETTGVIRAESPGSQEVVRVVPAGRGGRDRGVPASVDPRVGGPGAGPRGRAQGVPLV